MRRSVFAAGLLVACAAAFSQTAQTAQENLSFDVASVKPAAAVTPGMGLRVMMRGGPGTEDPGQITYSGVTLKNVMTIAYGVKGYQVSGPAWMDSVRFDIVAKIPHDTTKEQFKVMLQNLLKERFGLELHHESKDLPMYDLVVAKGGVKMKESVEDPSAAAPIVPGTLGGPSSSTPPPPPPPPAGGGPIRLNMGPDGMPKLPPGMGKMGIMMMMMPGKMRMIANGQPVSALSEMLGNQLGKPVMDKTGLTAKYDFTLEFLPEDNMRMMMPGGAMPMQHSMPASGGAADGGAMPGGGGSADVPTAPPLPAALQAQLGLKLESKKGPVDTLVIDKLNQIPTEN